MSIPDRNGFKSVDLEIQKHGVALPSGNTLDTHDDSVLAVFFLFGRRDRVCHTCSWHDDLSDGHLVKMRERCGNLSQNNYMYKQKNKIHHQISCFRGT